MYKILVCGGRNYYNYQKVCEVLNPIWDELDEPVMLIEGGARGADTLGRMWAGTKQHIVTKTYYADWKTHGKGAGAIRNQKMLDEENPNLIVAFPGGSGTADMIKRAKKAGIPVLEVKDDA